MPLALELGALLDVELDERGVVPGASGRPEDVAGHARRGAGLVERAAVGVAQGVEALAA